MSRWAHPPGGGRRNEHLGLRGRGLRSLSARWRPIECRGSRARNTGAGTGWVVHAEAEGPARSRSARYGGGRGPTTTINPTTTGRATRQAMMNQKWVTYSFFKAVSASMRLIIS
jgi:hypothetical protein